MSAKHTPGPWKVCVKDGLLEVWTERHQIADLTSQIPRFTSRKEVEANANLISVAPLLLSVLEDVTSAYKAEISVGFSAGHEELIRRCEDLLKKARGGE